MNRILIFLIVAFTLAHFIGLGISPPGFYVDEAAAAAHVICLQQTGMDFFNHPYPLFSDGFDGGFYTPALLYGEYLWTAIFGHSVAAFRSFSAMVTALTILFLCLWIRGRERATSGGQTRLVLWVALSAAIMPWAFQFSRIAWDPPLSTLFLVMALWACGSGSRLNARIMPGIFLALAAYSYPPMRVIAVALWCILPGRTWREKFQDIAIFALASIPLLIHTADPTFTARGSSLAIWGSDPENPYAHADPSTLVLAFFQQMAEHLTFSFLFVCGDANLRHSIQATGMLSWLDAFAWIGGAILALLIVGKKRAWDQLPQKEILFISLAGALIAIAPAALTWEGLPHSLRSIAAWPFFALLSGYLLSRVDEYLHQQERLHALWLGATAIIAIGFFAFYMNHLFTDYRVAAAPWFQTEGSPLALAYQRMVDEGYSCAALPR